MKMTFAHLAPTIFISCLGFAHAENVLLHDGPTVFTPDAIVYSPQSDQQSGKNLEFKYQFFIDSTDLNRLPSGTIEQGHSVITATKAIDLATSSLNPTAKNPTILRLELMSFRASATKVIDYYIITMLENRSEVHRVVLMNESVIKPIMKQVK